MSLKRTVIVLIALIALLALPIAGIAGGASMIGVKVTAPVPSAVESIRDVQANAPSRISSVSGDRAIPFKRIRKPGDTSVFTPSLSLSLSPAVSALFAPASMAPALDSSFAGLGNPPPGSDVVPPDTMGAAGPSHLVSALNSDVGIFNKAGTLLSQVDLDAFWTFPDSPGETTYDPRVLFDQHSGRFILSSAGGRSAPNSYIMIAVSNSSDPTGSWVKVAIDADLDNNVQTFNNSADFPGLGVDDTNIYVAANMFNASDIYQYSKVWVIPKNQPIFNNQPGNLTWTEFRDPTGLGRFSSSLQPSHTFGAPGSEYFVYEGGAGSISIGKVTLVGDNNVWSNIGSVTVNSFNSLPNFPQGLPQLGNPNTIDGGDTRIMNAVFRNNSLWTTHHVWNNGKIEVAWYQIDPLSLSIPVQQGRISHSSRWYVYPSIAVNQSGDVAVGFSGSSATEYMSAYYTARRSGDAAGTMQPVTLLKSGESSYFKTLSGFDNRWGDYSATTIDPSDDLTFWTLQEYAKTPVSGVSKWGTWWGKFHTSAVNAPTGLSATAVSTSRIDLGWTDSSNETGYTIERRLAPAGDYAVIATLGADNISYIDNTGLAASSSYFYRVKATSGSNGSYSNEASATTATPPAAPAGGGGGGGCAVIPERNSADADPSPLGTVLPLLIPLGMLALRRMRHSRRAS